MEHSEFAISFQADWTVTFLDKEGCIKFHFELGREPKELELHKAPLDQEKKRITVKGNMKERVDFAWSKVMEYLHERQYRVEQFEN